MKQVKLPTDSSRQIHLSCSEHPATCVWFVLSVALSNCIEVDVAADKIYILIRQLSDSLNEVAFSSLNH